ncbi:MAG TPA: nitroreductase family protein [Segeticoccus sp.]|uniref:nitroreductase family protein n=1 Tax=Segeticoccus sp. TaxID=2706531 RepID=UPI002D7E741D|nr:nitroreductase family protein [Segeticoccus sp.]HET8601169.1 nitroreductase family protein [Segeticoccus sp.]HEX4776064.1 nitroreductase family protein [Acidimicrobiia bacterium]
MRLDDVDELLTTTRAVRRRLDLTRPVEPGLLRECLALALQAPSGSNDQEWHFVVVTDDATRAALADVYRRAAVAYNTRTRGTKTRRRTLDDGERATRRRVLASAGYLYEHVHEVPAFVVPCVDGRFDGAPLADQATAFGSILPAVWSFMLAARSRGLGTSWTTAHLELEAEAATVLGIPFDEVTQVALIPVGHTLGDDFRPAPRRPVDDVVHWDRW